MEGKASVTICVGGGLDVIDKLSQIMGSNDEYLGRQTASVGCYGVGRIDQRFQYIGIQDCRAAALFYGGPSPCTIGCLGLGTCASVCPFNAIRMRADGLPEIDPEICRGCGRCVDACPQGVISLSRMTERLFHLNKISECLAPCRQKCPAQVNVPIFIRHLLKKNMEAALLTIKERHPFPLIIGRTCPHPCENICRRNLVDGGVAINHLARYLGEWERQMGKHLQISCAQETGRKVAVIGGGPAGLACAYFLRRAGHRPVIYEAMPLLGGLLRYGIPEYRLPQKIVDWEIEGILRLGVEVRTGCALGGNFTLTELEKKGYQAFFLGLGAWVIPKLFIPDESATGILGSLDFLSKVGTSLTDLTQKNVIVVGESNTAMDCARSSIRLGAESVTVICPCERKDMSARIRDVNRALEEGVTICFRMLPVRVVSNNTGGVSGLVCRSSSADGAESIKKNGNVAIDGTITAMNAEMLIVANERKPDLCYLLDPENAKYGFQISPKGTLDAERFSQLAAEPNIFTAGDLHTGRATVVSAVAGGRMAARSIHHFLSEGRIPIPDDIQRKINPKSILKEVRISETVPRIRIGELPVPMRRISFREEVIATIDENQAQFEAKRCLQCGTYCYNKKYRLT